MIRYWLQIIKPKASHFPEMRIPLFLVPFTTHFTVEGKRLLEIDNTFPAFCKDHFDGIMP